MQKTKHRIIKLADILSNPSQCYNLYATWGISPTLQSGEARYGGLSPYILEINE